MLRAMKLLASLELNSYCHRQVGHGVCDDQYEYTDNVSVYIAYDQYKYSGSCYIDDQYKQTLDQIFGKAKKLK